MICYHCGDSFHDPFIEELHAAFPSDLPMTRHGEDGVLLGAKDKPELCEKCASFPPEQLAKIIEEMIELQIRKHYGGLS